MKIGLIMGNFQHKNIALLVMPPCEKGALSAMRQHSIGIQVKNWSGPLFEKVCNPTKPERQICFKVILFSTMMSTRRQNKTVQTKQIQL